MKKTKNKLLISTLVLVLTLALTATSTFAWFNMNREASVGNFEVSITKDTGFQIAVVPYVYDVTKEKITGDITAPTVDEKNLDYKENFDFTKASADLKAIFNHRLLAVTKTATGFSDVSGTEIADQVIDSLSFPSSAAGGYYNTVAIKFRVYVRSTAEKSIYVAKDGIKLTEKAGETVKEVTTKSLEIVKARLATEQIDMTKLNTWLNKATPTLNDKFEISSTVTDGDNALKSSYVTATIICTDATLKTFEFLSNGTAGGGVAKIKAFNPSNALRVSIGDTDTGTGVNQIVYDRAYKGDFDPDTGNAKAIKAADLEKTATTNVGWLYYTSSLGVAAPTFQAPSTNAGDYKIPVVKLAAPATTGDFTYGYFDVNMWLDGFDAECFDSIIGLQGSLNFNITSIQPIA